MEKEIILKLTAHSTKDIKFVFQKMDEIADLVGMDKIELEMRNKEKKKKFWEKAK
jgi:ABC-type lipoprotein export system ATPase subunit